MKITATKIVDKNILVINSLPTSRAGVTVSWVAISADGTRNPIEDCVAQRGKIACEVDTTFEYSYTKRELVGYALSAGGTLTPEQYHTTVRSFHSDGAYDHDAYDHDADEWLDIDAEYAYKKFISGVTSQYAQVVKTELATIEITNVVQFDTGSEYITTTYVVGGDASKSVYTLFRYSAAYDAFCEVMQNLGMVHDTTDCDYRLTDGKKIWSNRGNDLRYAKAFNTYIFSDENNPTKMFAQQVSHSSIDVLSDMRKKDAEWIKDYVTTRYNRHFGNRTPSHATLSKLHYGLESLRSLVRGLDVKVSGRSSHNVAVAKITELFKMVEDELNNKE
jgi:hypothetical protein